MKGITNLKLILDTNIIFSALINKTSSIRNILRSDKITFLLPEMVLEEILEHKELLCRKTGLNKREVFFTLFYLLSKVKIVKREIYDENLEKARKIMENIDIHDSEFLALALSMENDGIFSNDKHFNDAGIRKWSVKEILDWLERQ